jgi:hypothetical protein
MRLFGSHATLFLGIYCVNGAWAQSPVPASQPTVQSPPVHPRHRRAAARVEQTQAAASVYAKQPLCARVPTPEEVAWALTSPFTSERLKAWSIYVWLLTNIAYDRKVYTADRSQVQVAPVEVLRCRKTSCERYARLFNELCAEAGIEAVKVVGVAKGGGIADERHAWSLVRLEGQWVEVDATWGSSFQSLFYFAPNPELFKYSHYAFDREQQLSPARLTRAQFDAQDGIRGDSDPWWRRCRSRADSGELKHFDLQLR